MRLIRPVLLLVATFALACAPATAGRTTMRNKNFISQEELQAARYSNLYDAINTLRPAFLRSRGRNTFDPNVTEYPAVYQDGQRFGELQILKTMPLDQVKSVRYLSAPDATTKYGSNHTAGVIEVTTR